MFNLFKKTDAQILKEKLEKKIKDDEDRIRDEQNHKLNVVRNNKINFIRGHTTCQTGKHIINEYEYAQLLIKHVCDKYNKEHDNQHQYDVYKSDCVSYVTHVYQRDIIVKCDCEPDLSYCYHCQTKIKTCKIYEYGKHYCEHSGGYKFNLDPKSELTNYYYYPPNKYKDCCLRVEITRDKVGDYFNGGHVFYDSKHVEEEKYEINEYFKAYIKLSLIECLNCNMYENDPCTYSENFFNNIFPVS